MLGRIARRWGVGHGRPKGGGPIYNIIENCRDQKQLGNGNVGSCWTVILLSVLLHGDDNEALIMTCLRYLDGREVPNYTNGHTSTLTCAL